MRTTFRALRSFAIAAVACSLAFFLLSPGARADEVISLTAATPCPSTNGSGGDWCQGNGGPAFNLSSFTTQNISLTGSSAFFEITNNTGHEETKLTLDFAGTLLNGPATCGGGSTGIQGSGPGNGSTTCTISPISGGFAITWNNLTWGAGTPFDLQIASFSNGTTGVFKSVPEPGTLGLLGAGMMGLSLILSSQAPGAVTRRERGFGPRTLESVSPHSPCLGWLA